MNLAILMAMIDSAFIAGTSLKVVERTGKW
jgi:hypothetical protein